MPSVAEASTPEKLHAALSDVHKGFLNKSNQAGHTLVPIAGDANGPTVFRQMPNVHKSTRYSNIDDPEKAYALMKACRENPIPLGDFPGQAERMGKASVTVASGIYGYDLRAPSIHLIPFLSPIRDETARTQHRQPGNAAHWKTLSASGFSVGGFAASPWINEGQRAPSMSITTTPNNASYATIGIDGSDTYEAQSAGQDFEDPLSTARFLGLEALMVKEEDALLGGNATLKLGQTNTPTNVASGSGSLTGSFYIACVGLTYEGYRNQSATLGLVQQLNTTTPDGKAMQVNGGTAQPSAISSVVSPSSSAQVLSTVVPKRGEMAYAWYIGTSNSTAALHLVAITTIPTYTFTSTPATSGQLLSLLSATDYSVNDGTTGGGAAQVTAFDGFITQCLNAFYNGGGTPNAQYTNLLGAHLTSSGTGSIKEIDTIFQYAWDNFRVWYDEMWVNSQQLKDITAGVLSNASGPLLRYEKNADGDQYDLTASGVIAFYFNPFIPNGGRKIPVRVHPTIPPGTIFLKGNMLPPWFKKSNMTTTAEVICRRDYYSIDWAQTTREYQFGTYAEEVLAVYAPFTLAVIAGIGGGIGT